MYHLQLVDNTLLRSQNYWIFAGSYIDRTYHLLLFLLETLSNYLWQKIVVVIDL